MDHANNGNSADPGKDPEPDAPGAKAGDAAGPPGGANGAHTTGDGKPAGLPDYLDAPALRDLDLTKAETRAVLCGQHQLHRDELADRLEMFRREREGHP